MRKLKLTKLLASILVLTSVLALNPIAASAEWRQDNKGWWYTEGNSWARGFRKIDGNLYYFKSNGYMTNNSSNMFLDKEYGLNSSGQFTNVTINGEWAFCKLTGKIVAYLGSESSINIPDKIDNTTVTGIGVDAFSGCNNLTNITIPNSVKGIYDHAFKGCKSLTNITIPSSVTKMGNSIFSSCYNLTNVTIENGVTFLGNATFSDCVKLTNITLPNTLKSIGESTFEGCTSLKNIVIPSGVTKISNTAFSYCTNLTSLTLPDGLTDIGMGAFKDCTSLTSITIPSSVQNIKTRTNGPGNIVIETNLFEGCGNVKVYVKSETTKQLLVNSGVSASQIITIA